MSLEIKTYGSKVNFNTSTQISFTYDGTVQQYLFGFQNFDLSYGGVDHHVQLASVALSNTSKVGNTISTTITAQLQDDNGHLIDNNSSTALLSGIAWVGSTPNDATVLLAPTFQSGGSDTSLPLTGTNPTVLQPTLAGFYVTYGSSDHHVESFSLSLNATSSGSQATIGGTVFMGDDNGHDDASASLTPGLLAGTGTGRGFVVVPLTVTTATNAATIDFTAAIEADLNVSSLSGYTVTLTAVTGLVSGFNLVYPNNHDHHVKAISIGCWGGIAITSGTLKAVATNVGAWMYDNSGNWSDPNLSNVTMAFIATYTAVANQ